MYETAYGDAIRIYSIEYNGVEQSIYKPKDGFDDLMNHIHCSIHSYWMCYMFVYVLLIVMVKGFHVYNISVGICPHLSLIK